MIKEWVALYEAPSSCARAHHGAQTFGLCAMVLIQVKAAGLVRAFDPLTNRLSQYRSKFSLETNNKKLCREWGHPPAQSMRNISFICRSSSVDHQINAD